MHELRQRVEEARQHTITVDRDRALLTAGPTDVELTECLGLLEGDGRLLEQLEQARPRLADAEGGQLVVAEAGDLVRGFAEQDVDQMAGAEALAGAPGGGQGLLRGEEIKIPPFRGEGILPSTPKAVDAWAHDGWVDLRVANMTLWKGRFKEIMKMTAPIPAGDTSSRFIYTKDYWNNFETIEPGRIVGWIFSYEEKGLRMKA